MSDQQVVVDTTGIGNAEAHLAKVAAQVKNLERRLKEAGGESAAATKTTKELTAAQKLEATQLGANAKGFQDVVGKITGFIGAATFAAGAVGGLVAGIAELIGRQRSLDEVLESSSKALTAQAAATTKLIAELDKAANAYLDLAAAQDANLAATLKIQRAEEKRADVEAELRGRTAALEIMLAQHRQMLLIEEATIKGLEYRAKLEAQIGSVVAGGFVDSARREEQLAELESQRQRRLADIQRLQEAIARAMGQQVTASQSLEFVGPRIADAGPAPAPTRRGGPRDTPPPNPMAQALADGHQDFLRAQAEAAEEAEESVADYAARLAAAYQDTQEASRIGTLAGQLQLMQLDGVEAERLRHEQELTRIAQAGLSDREAAILAEISLIKLRTATETAAVNASAKAASDRASIWQSSLQAARALGEGSEEVTRGIALVEGAVEQGRALARLAVLDFVGFAAHQAAAISLFAAAGRSSGGGAAAGGRGTAAREPERTGPTGGGAPSIVVLGDGARDPQDLVRMVARGHRAAYYSGQGQRGAW